jgi:tRNA 2-thiouridine synthesizing protein E
MPTLDFEGQTVQTDREGFLLDGSQWTPEVAEHLARLAGIVRLTDRHWKVIALCREDTARERRQPGIKRLARLTHYETDQLERLFLDRASELIPRIAGLPRPSDDATRASNPKEHGS